MLNREFALQILNLTDHFLKKKNKKVIGLINDKLFAQILKEFVGLRAKTYCYSKDKNDEDKKVRGTKIIKTVQKQLKLIIK